MKIRLPLITVGLGAMGVMAWHRKGQAVADEAKRISLDHRILSCDATDAGIWQTVNANDLTQIIDKSSQTTKIEFVEPIIGWLSSQYHEAIHLGG